MLIRQNRRALMALMKTSNPALNDNTFRGEGVAFSLTDKDHSNTEIQKRIRAIKRLKLEPNRDPKKLADEIAKLAKTFDGRNRAVLGTARYSAVRCNFCKAHRFLCADN